MIRSLKLSKYVKGNECIENVFKHLSCLENIIENNELYKQKQINNSLKIMTCKYVCVLM